MYKEISQERKQELFDKSIGGVWKQGDLSFVIIKSQLNGENLVRCCYRNSDGLRCAAGQLIPDDKYEDRFENVSSTSPILERSMGIGAHESNFVRRMQLIHDSAAAQSLKNNNYMNIFKADVLIFAQKEGLNADFLNS